MSIRSVFGSISGFFQTRAAHSRRVARLLDCRADMEAKLCEHEGRVAKLEYDLKDALDDVAEKTAEIDRIEREREAMRAEMQIMTRNLEMLSDIIARDRERVRAETAIYCQLIDGNREVISPIAAVGRAVNPGVNY